MLIVAKNRLGRNLTVFIARQELLHVILKRFSEAKKSAAAV